MIRIKIRAYKCTTCNGEMRVDDYENGKQYSEDGKMPCPTCEGTGELDGSL